MAEAKNVDDLIINNIQRQQNPGATIIYNNGQAPAQSAGSSEATPTEEAVQDNAPIPAQSQPQEQPIPEQAPSEPKQEEVLRETAPEQPISSDSPIDEYGNPISKPKMYSEEEVQRIIRERLARGKNPEQPHQQQPRQDENFKVDPNSEDSWEQQLETFIERTLEKRQKKIAEKQWEEQQIAAQQEFESKFVTDMNKYGDFHQVVSGKPITNDMLLATKSLKNPASFIYAACKLYPQEITRIAQLSDSRLQAMEVGRLHERMQKTGANVSSASRSLGQTVGDMPVVKTNNQPSLEDRIAAYAKQKRR